MGYGALQTSVLAACDEQQLLGDELRAHLAREIPAKVLLRNARDVVLLTGATGSGKEKVAATVHAAARHCLRRHGDLVEVSCANLGGTLFESELFGYRRGAFTGAERDHGGLVARAAGGTLVLDEVQALEAPQQARLLRFLGEREYRAIGDERVRSTDALILLSSNCDLEALARTGAFRRDLLDRAAAKIFLPSLYQRRRDIGALAQAFVLEAATEMAGASASTAARAFLGLTRRARADVEAAVVTGREVSVRRLREVMRDALFEAAADDLPEALDSEMLMPHLGRAFGFNVDARDREDTRDLTEDFASIVGRTQLQVIASRHGASPRSVDDLCRAVRSLIADMERDGTARTYRLIVERLSRLSKAALWIVSGANTQAEFRRFFGSGEFAMPPKSVAHQVYYQVFGDDEGDGERGGGHA